MRGGRVVFQDLSFDLADGGCLVLSGPNGSGKSSLLRIMAGLHRPFAGRLAWDGAPLADDPGAHRARQHYIGHLDAVKPAFTALENLLFWSGLRGPGRDAASRALAALDALGVAAIAPLPGRFLSAGQRRRLTLARLLVDPAPLWLLDEPTVALDIHAVGLLESAIARHRAGGGLVVLSTHIPIALPGATPFDVAAFTPQEDEAGDEEAVR